MYNLGRSCSFDQKIDNWKNISEHIFLDVRCQLHGYLVVWKITIICIVEKNFCISLREYAVDVNNLEKNKMLLKKRREKQKKS